jgi:hypothetical protein
VPALLLDDAIDQFLRSNLALWLAQKLIQHQLLDEASAVLEVIHVEDVADPASYYIHSAVCAFHLSQVAKVTQSLEDSSAVLGAAPPSAMPPHAQNIIAATTLHHRAMISFY